MFRSKYLKITGIALGLLVLSCIGFYVFSQTNNIQTEQVAKFLNCDNQSNNQYI